MIYKQNSPHCYACGIDTTDDPGSQRVDNVDTGDYLVLCVKHKYMFHDWAEKNDRIKRRDLPKDYKHRI